MYADFFGLEHLPFNNTPDPRFFFSTPDHEEALASLIYAVQELKGCVLLTGEVGTGKTLVSRMMLRRFGDRISFANITHSTRSAVDLMESVLAEFGLGVPDGASNASLVRILHDHLLAQFANNRPVVLVLDEAQNLTVDAFEQLRMIGNLEADDAKLLQIVILGQPELQRLIRSPRLRQLHQRIFRSFHLTALSRPVTGDYIRHRLAVAGATSPDVFDEGAIDRVHAFAQGLPRLINTACDNAMLGAYSSGRRRIDGAFMESVIDQLETEATGATGASTPSTDTDPTGAAGSAEGAPRSGDAGEAAPADTRGSSASDMRVDRSDAGSRVERWLSGRLDRLEKRFEHMTFPGAGAGPASDPSARSGTPTVTEGTRADGAGPSSDPPARPADGGGSAAARVRDHARHLGRIEARLASVERAVHAANEDANPASETLTQLHAAMAEARDVLRAQGAVAHSADASRRRTHELTRLVKGVLEQTRLMLARLDATTAQADRAERQARQTFEHLAVQAQRTERLSTVVGQIFDRVEHQLQALAAGATSGHGVAAGGGKERASRPDRAVPANDLVSRSTRALVDLRALIRESDAAFSDLVPRPPGARDDAPPDAPTPGTAHGLVRRVDELLDVVERADAAAAVPA